MLNGHALATFRKQLLGWFRQFQRDLPWRQTSDPYRIWLSEIMLQQTRVAAAIPYYERFSQRFPDVHALAAAPQEEVLRLWSGLGYYSRARPCASRRNSRRPPRAAALARLAKKGGSFARTKITGRLEPSRDGTRRNAVHSKIAAMPALPGRAILRRAQAGSRRILARKKKEARHGGSHSGRCGIRGWKRADSSVSTAEKYKRESLCRSRADVGFKNVAFPNTLGDRRTSRETDRISTQTHSRCSRQQMATRTGRQGPSRGNVPRHHPLALPHHRRKTSPRPRREASSAR